MNKTNKDKMIKAIFFDIDGTLVSFKTHHIPQSTIDAIRKTKAKGIKIYISTGRKDRPQRQRYGLAQQSTV